jgi:maltose O-acetyltransferase
MFVRTRAAILRSWGLKIGKGTTISGTPVLAGDVDPRRNLTIGDRCCINWPLHLDVNAPITIGDRASIGHHVVIITTDHEIGDQLARACGVVPKPVTIGSGSWIGAAATILPGTTIGDGAIVSAGALVSGTVAPNTVVGGVPARFIRNLQ